ncbi:DMT family transporter [Rhizobium lentis]|uniref:Drug/metabolite transporter (DMT)-like permease n=1 Tax=Rhizobium lentis TaxID=1138194 RepID=A0A7W8XEX4_9HYPH|nr:DMT family transporter [Rhizobium lentis]MBB4574705.1 drug/metabolite transporter (DMT)-like permease [Rhizobium lentis]MBB5550632.1 drug/metabolite transporter (DMT)-like permease [Rhizobium lentis]MBB5561246.1 drug/metabolite transporter (DMT)-like permease [Rhizobium lentis]MBB5567751.1 drug/metabolite transporter (DMT)-like permease [Rhizobium lentis]
MANVVLFIATVLIWGTTWIAIAMQVGPVPVLVSVFYRFALAAVILVAILAAMRRLKVPALRDQPFILAQALCLFSLNFICFYNAAAFVPSGLISVIFSLATIYNAVNARLFFGDRITGRTLFAAALGATGLLLLFGDEVVVDFDMGTLKGIGLAALGTLFFSLGNMASRRNSAAGISPLTANAWGMTYGAIILLVLIAVTRTPIVAPSGVTYLAALLYLSTIGSVIGFTTYLMLVSRIGSSRAAYATVLFPIVALSLSTVFEGYHWSGLGLIGLALTLLGNVIIFARPLARRSPQPDASLPARG